MMHKITEDSGGFPNIKPLYYTVISLAGWDVDSCMYLDKVLLRTQTKP